VSSIGVHAGRRDPRPRTEIDGPEGTSYHLHQSHAPSADVLAVVIQKYIYGSKWFVCDKDDEDPPVSLVIVALRTFLIFVSCCVPL